LPIKEVLVFLNTSFDGITIKEAKKRQKLYGINNQVLTKKHSTLNLLLGQFKSPFIYLLLIAAIIVYFLEHDLNSYLILGVVLINAVIGFFQENKAQNALEALKKLMSTKARVIRDGLEEEISSLDIVPGDIVVLESGMKVPADLRLIESQSLKIDESTLTGESVPTYKETRELKSNLNLVDQKNMAFSGTLVSTGRALGVVVAIGLETELGQIANEINTEDEGQTPLHNKIANFSKTILVITIILCLIILILGIFRGYNIDEIFLISVSMAISIIPEGLPAIITIALAVGVHRMVKQNALTRRLAAIETLGAITTIASDKTGTLTHNQMTVERIEIDNNTYKITGDGYEPIGKIIDADNQPIKYGKMPQISKFFTIASLCNNSQIIKENNEWQALGDPTEAALICASQKINIHDSKLKDAYLRIDEIPFSEEIMYMATLHKTPTKTFFKKNKNIIAVKGSLEKILSKSSHICVNNKINKLTNGEKRRILIESEKLAENGYRILSIAYKEVGIKQDTIDDKDISDLIFLGYCGLDDPPRREAIQAIENCNKAGIKVLMLTGDYSKTALSVANKLGLASYNQSTLSGEEIDQLDDIELANRLRDTIVFARLNPQNKLRIVKLLQSNGEIIGVTGDGVNDAPILKQSDIGISMGIGGTDTARESSDMVLLDNNFTTIIAAIEEGRNIIQNIKRVIFFLLSTNVGEIILQISILFIGLPLPLSALQILWINFITDTTAGLALVMEPKNENILNQRPKKLNEALVTKPMMWRIFVVGIFMSIVSIWAYKYSLASGLSLGESQTVVFALLAILQLFNIFNSRSFSTSIFKIKLFSNMWVWYSFIGSILMTILTIEWMPFQLLFNTTSLDLYTWVMIILLSMSILIIVELDKLFRLQIENNKNIFKKY